ncbi:MAG: phage tail tape measure protein, partial [Bacteroidales bacterium]|nr:phage tail tape measure protein [Bacteroidales bacterium]
DAIGATKEKLDSLKQAQEQAKQQLENGDLGQDKYDALQREIVETEQELQRLQQEAEKANSTLSKIDAVGQKMETVGNSIAGAGKKMMPVTLAIGGVGTAAVKTAADFDTAMSQVAAVSGATGEDFDKLRAKAREMGSKTKFSASEAAEAMNYMAMAGWKTEDMLDGIEGIMNLAAASGEDLATTSDIVTDALTAFGLSAKDSGHFADILAAASSNANTNVSMMGETFKYCAPIAGAMGYSAEDTAQAIGLMANSGIKGSQAGTALRTIMTKLQGELKLSGAAFGDMTIQTANADGSMRDLNDILADCRVAFGQMTESEKAQAAETLVGKNAMSGFLALMNAAPADIAKLEGAIDNCNGTSEEMAEIMQDNLSGQLTILKSQLEELAISFGDLLMPAIRNIVSKIQAFVDKLNGMDDSQRKVIIRIALLVAAIAPLLVIIGTTISKIGVAMQGFVKLAGAVGKMKTAMSAGTGIMGKLGAALGGISAPVLAVVAVIAVLVAAFVHLWKTNDKFREAILGTWQRIKETVSNFVEGIRERLSALGIDFGDIVETIKKIWNGFCALLAPVFEGAFKVIASVLETVLGVITGLLDVFIGIFTGNWDQAWTGVKEIFSSIWEGIKGVLSAVLETLKGLLDTFLGWFGTSWSEVWSGIKTFFEGIWNGITTFITGVLTGIKNFFVGIWEGIKSVVTGAMTAIQTTMSTIWNAISGVVTTVWETIKSVVQVAILFIKELLTAAFNILTIPWRFIWENFGGVITAAWEKIKEVVSTAIDAIKTVIETVWNAIVAFLTPILNTLKTAFTTAWTAIKTLVSTVVNAIKTTIQTVWNAIKTFLTTVLNAIKQVFTTVWNAIKQVVTTVVNAIKTTVTNVWNAIKGTVSSVMNSIKSTVSSIWNSIKGTVSSVVNGIKSTVTSAFNGLKSSVSSIFNSIKSTATSVWNNIKTAITNPITKAKDTVKSMIDRIRSFFNFSWSLPHLKLPHVHISGHFSLTPPSVPHFSIDWYKKGGIMTSPTLFGMNGSSLMAGGEAGAEAILPLKGFYTQLAQMLDERLNMAGMERYLAIIADNSSKGIYLEDGTLVGHLLPAIDSGLAKYSMRGGRGNR